MRPHSTTAAERAPEFIGTEAQPSSNVLTHQYVLLPLQRRLVPFARPLSAVCELSARVLRRRRLSPAENTQRAYEQLFDVVCAQTGIWTDYTEGHYPTRNETYEEAQEAQTNAILDALACAPGARLLDVGCGNGSLLRRAQERGIEAVGITVSRVQEQRCRSKGLDVRLCRVEDLLETFADTPFDAIVMNGSTEHFVSELDVLEGRADDIRRSLFRSLAGVLNPKGRVFTTCIHFRHETPIEEVIKHPLEHPVGSYFFHCSTLVQIFSGYYPTTGTYEAFAKEAGMKTVQVRDATEDYYLTSRQWGTRVKWTWQFRGGDESPMVHLWHLFELEKPR